MTTTDPERELQAVTETTDDPSGRPVLPDDLKQLLGVEVAPAAAAREPIVLTRGKKALIGAVAAFVSIIAGIGFAGSYTAVTKLAASKGFGWFAWAFPAGIDSGIGGFLALDLLLTWLRIPYPLLRPAAWFLTAATICFNSSAAWGDPVAVGMHATIPLLFVVAIEAARHAVGRIADITADRHIESPPLVRWLISPWPTYRIWRRMRLWQLPSYEQVIALERDNLVLRTRLRRRYGQKWRTAASERAHLALELSRYGIPVRDTLAAPLADIDPDNNLAVTGQSRPDSTGTADPTSTDSLGSPTRDTPSSPTPDSNVVAMSGPRQSRRTARLPTRTVPAGQADETLTGHVLSCIAGGITDTDTIFKSARDKFGPDTKRETVRRLVNRHSPDDAEDPEAPTGT